MIVKLRKRIPKLSQPSLEIRFTTHWHGGATGTRMRVPRARLPLLLLLAAAAARASTPHERRPCDRQTAIKNPSFSTQAYDARRQGAFPRLAGKFIYKPILTNAFKPELCSDEHVC